MRGAQWGSSFCVLGNIYEIKLSQAINEAWHSYCTLPCFLGDID